MHKTTRLRLALVWALALVSAGGLGACSTIEPVNAPALTSGSADFRSYVAGGTSISAGFQSGGLVSHHQAQSFPTLFARQIGMSVQANGQGSFSFNPYSADGFPPLSRIVSYSPLVVTNSGRVPGAAQNTAWPPAFRNMAVPFAILFDLVDSTFYYSQSFRPIVADEYFADIVRHRGTVAQEMLSHAPTFISLEYGSNEVLGPTSQGVPAATNTAEQYAAILAGALDQLHFVLPNAKVAVLNIPDVTRIPLVRTLSPFTVSLSTGQPVPLIGQGGPLQFGDFVLLTAAPVIGATGTGIPVGGYNYLNPSVPGNGQPLNEGLVLRAAEAGQTLTEIAEMNAAIAAQAAARPYMALVDFHAALDAIAANGLRVGSNTFTTDYITGGLFSLDGAHPSDLGQAVLCNTMVDAVNARFGSGVPRVDLMDWATPSASASAPVFPDGFRALPVRVDGLADQLPRPVPTGLIPHF